MPFFVCESRGGGGRRITTGGSGEYHDSPPSVFLTKFTMRLRMAIKPEVMQT